LALTSNPQERKDTPIYTGVMLYFPDALAEVARVSKVGNDQHNPGEPLHWAKEKSTDEGDALIRHQLEAGTRDTDGQRHSAKVAWRALAQLQREIDAERIAQEKPIVWMEAEEERRDGPREGLVAGRADDGGRRIGRCGLHGCQVCRP
jgi:hypothetical protein